MSNDRVTPHPVYKKWVDRNHGVDSWPREAMPLPWDHCP